MVRVWWGMGSDSVDSHEDHRWMVGAWSLTSGKIRLDFGLADVDWNWGSMNIPKDGLPERAEVDISVISAAGAEWQDNR